MLGVDKFDAGAMGFSAGETGDGSICWPGLEDEVVMYRSRR